MGCPGYLYFGRDSACPAWLSGTMAASSCRWSGAAPTNGMNQTDYMVILIVGNIAPGRDMLNLVKQVDS